MQGYRAASSLMQHKHTYCGHCCISKRKEYNAAVMLFRNANKNLGVFIKFWTDCQYTFISKI